MVAEVAFRETPKQEEFARAVFSGQYRHLLYGGAAGGGKTYILCALLILLCRIYPGSRWAIIRADLPRLKKTVIPTWNKLAPRSFFEPINRSDWYARAKNGSEVLFLAASEDIDPTYERARGLEINGAAFEECDELSEEYVDVLSSRLGRWKLAGRKDEDQPPILSFYSCNPNQKWPKKRFYEPWRNGTLRPGHYYLPAKVTDNPYLTPEYLQQLRDLPEKQRSVFFDGNWDYADAPDQLIHGEWVEATFAREPAFKRLELKTCVCGQPTRRTGDAVHCAPPEGTRPCGFRFADRHNGLGVDVARYGDDETVLARTRGWHLIEIIAFNGIDTARTAELSHLQAVTHQVPPHGIRVDTVGVGGGVADSLFRHHKMKPTEFVAGALAIGTHKFLKFKNLRSEAWWNLRELCEKGPASFARDLPLAFRNKLVADLTAQHYTADSDKVIEVLSKDTVKAEMGRSPDYGDAVMQVYAEMNSAAGYLARINTR